MTVETERRSATIYEFPRRVRTPSTISAEASRPNAGIVQLRLPRITFGSGWYHEAAIEEAELGRTQ